MKQWTAALSMAVLCVASAQCAFAQDVAERKNPLEGQAEAVEAGKALYSNTCLFCHGANGLGARAPNLVEGLFRPNGGADDTIVFDIIMKGRPGTLMGGYEGTLSDTEVWQVISYLRHEGIGRSKPKAK
ncbi:c-type cytochrome [Hyphomicrobium sp.]|uniref:c-type cytochrome n=1 Tax=Hyphomicrobium sp. TaxID=82 RepID=UPI0025BE8614|nr:c-type cytochrome [Hyphomicrobium sp.]MCC7253810.1 c-type cytochrome [Hyphomicrobium sp.]